jgi:hypothetical protein
MVPCATKCIDIYVYKHKVDTVIVICGTDRTYYFELILWGIIFWWKLELDQPPRVYTGVAYQDNIECSWVA